jgi:hypothetical protein
LKIEDLKSLGDTLMFVVVPPKHAVVWTRPESLAFDIDNVEDLLGDPLGAPQFWGVTFAGQVRAFAMVPNTEPNYEEWKRYVEAIVKGLPVPGLPEPGLPAPGLPVQEP